MVDLSGIKHIYIFPGITDMRLGIYGLRKRLLESEGEIRADSIYLFCGKLPTFVILKSSYYEPNSFYVQPYLSDDQCDTSTT